MEWCLSSVPYDDYTGIYLHLHLYLYLYLYLYHSDIHCNDDADCSPLNGRIGDPEQEFWCWRSRWQYPHPAPGTGKCGPDGIFPLCIEECVLSCLPHDNHYILTTEECNCVNTCDALGSNCSDEEKRTISHILHDICGLADPFFIAPIPAKDKVHCGFGQYVKNKGIAGQEICELCAPGKFSKAKTTRNKKCNTCKEGFVQPEEGHGGCYKCKEGMTHNEEHTRCLAEVR